MTDCATTIVQHNGHHPATVEQDEFNSEPFEDGRETLPYLQMLNHQNPDQSGFFITSENAETAGFVPHEEWSLHLER